jgi:uncharacterized delta-60 repeat protein
MKRYTVFSFFALFCILPAILSAQVDTAWVRRYDGGYGVDFASAIAVDATGNAYIAGYTYYGTQDFLTVKYLPNGDTAWVRRYDGTANGGDWARSIAVDASGNVYVTGEVINSGNNGVDYATIKYSSNGVQQWVRIYHGPSASGYDYPKAMALDNAGNIYVTGVSWYGVNDEDFITIKYRPNGDTAWIRNYNSPDNQTDCALAIAVSPLGKICIVGYSNDGSADQDIVIIQYDTAGTRQWLRNYRFGHNDQPSSVKYDSYGNIYITGYFLSLSSGYDCFTMKYLANGDTAWSRTYNSAGANGDKSNAIVIDNQNNVIITGSKGGANDDCLTIKYNTNGVEQWVRSYNGTGNIDDQGNSITIDNNNNVYITGFTYTTTYDYLTIKYNSSGSQQWLQTYNGPGNVEDRINATAVDNNGNCYITGVSGGTSTVDCATIKYSQGQGIEQNCEPLAVLRTPLKIFPNPAKTYFVVNGPWSMDHRTIKIYDVTGKLVKVEKFKGLKEARISLDVIKNGIYFIKVSNEFAKEKLVVTK